MVPHKISFGNNVVVPRRSVEPGQIVLSYESTYASCEEYVGYRYKGSVPFHTQQFANLSRFRNFNSRKNYYSFLVITNEMINLIQTLPHLFEEVLVKGSDIIKDPSKYWTPINRYNFDTEAYRTYEGKFVLPNLRLFLKSHRGVYESFLNFYQDSKAPLSKKELFKRYFLAPVDERA